MRALVISDTHVGAWTGRDLPRLLDLRAELDPLHRADATLLPRI